MQKKEIKSEEDRGCFPSFVFKSVQYLDVAAKKRYKSTRTRNAIIAIPYSHKNLFPCVIMPLDL